MKYKRNAQDYAQISMLGGAQTTKALLPITGK
jgi:hypothetical protein